MTRRQRKLPVEEMNGRLCHGKKLKDEKICMVYSIFDEKMEDLSAHDTDFGAGKEALQVMNLLEEEQAIYISHEFNSLPDEADISGSVVRDEDLYSPEPNVSSNSNLDSSSASVKSPGSIKGKPTLMGLVILGHRGQKDRLQTQQLKLKVNINDELVKVIMNRKNEADLDSFEIQWNSSGWCMDGDYEPFEGSINFSNEYDIRSCNSNGSNIYYYPIQNPALISSSSSSAFCNSGGYISPSGHFTDDSAD
ncbi:hypothetical protein FRX31_013985 [Thalictrum thalictroides]|uniref:Uncharacterized protein n=1 Tax=Thalictrum thalictroides TaxID=46969 RepID=A0A7J6WJ08_THATH|nr:hypothetical protein FRX31_013985 [Thalictrum thalictroides]